MALADANVQKVNATDKTSSASWAVTTFAGGSGTVYAADHLCIIALGTDNNDTTDGATSLHTSIVPSDGSATFSKLIEFTNGQGAAAAGATISLWMGIGTASFLSTLDDLQVELAAAVTAKALGMWAFSRDAALTITQDPTTATRADDGADPGSMTLSSLTSREYLCLRATAAESNSATGFTPTSGFTQTGNFNGTTTGGGGAANMAVRMEWIISTATSFTSDPTLFSADCASVMVALYEASAAVGSLVIPHRHRGLIVR